MGEEGVESREEAKRLIIASSLVLIIASSLAMYFFQDKPIVVFSIDKSMIGKKVIVIGRIEWIKQKNGISFGEVNTGVSKVFFFDPNGRRAFNGRMEGRVGEYKGRVELIVE